MTVHNHAIVWIDHRVANVFYLGLDDVDERTVHADLEAEHMHHKANTIGSGKAHDDPTFFPRIDEALQNSEAIVIVGPGNEKTLLLKHLKEDCVRTRRVKSTQRPVITRPTANHRVGTP